MPTEQLRFIFRFGAACARLPSLPFPGCFSVYNTGKTLIWCDPLYPCGVSDARMRILFDAAERAIQALSPADDRMEVQYARTLFIALRKKIALIWDIRNAYGKRDKVALSRAANAACPAAMKAYDDLLNTHRILWEKSCKRQGWEVLALRYGGAIGRIQDVKVELQNYCGGSLPCIAELDEPSLPDGKGFTYDRVSTPSAKT